MKIKKEVFLKFIYGVFLGYLICFLLAGQSVGEQGIVPSLIFTIKNYRFHLHHWFLLTLLFLFQFFRKNSFSETMNGFIIGGIIQGIYNYPDWYQIIVKIIR